MNRKIILAASIAFLGAATYLLGYSTFFTVSSVDVIGSKRPIATGILPGQKLARVEPRAIVTRLETLDWVESVDISRNWINGKVIVKLTQRTPVAIFKNQLIDATGKSFIAQAIPSRDLVEIQAANSEAATKAVNFFTQLPEELKSKLMVVKVRSTGAFVLIMENNQEEIELRWGADSENDLKVRVYKALVALPENSNIKRVDVSAPHAPIVK